MAGTADERLLALIEASDTVLGESGESEDPVASRRVAEALARKAAALRQLGRHGEAVVVWDTLIRRQSAESSTVAALLVITALYWKARDLEQLGRAHEALAAFSDLIARSQGLPESDQLELLVVRALAARARVLAAEGNADAAIRSAEEVAIRAGQSDDPELRQQAAWALEYESRLLIAAGRIDQALSVSSRLESRLRDEPPESLVGLVEIINNHSLLLLQLGAPNPAAVARFILLVLINTAVQSVDHSISWVGPHLPGRAPHPAGLPRTRRSDKLDVFSIVRNSRRRGEQARASSRAVIQKTASSEDPDLRRCAATAEFIVGLSLVVLGHPVAGFRAIETFTNRNDLDAIQAFQWLGKRSREDSSVVKELGVISSAALRARMLGNGDPVITQIAYEDSLLNRQAHPTLRRVMTRFLRPKVDEKPTGNTDSREHTQPRDGRIT